ncbi:methionyl-tRNA formyltransferase [Paucibacter sp. XJ19-41]|uniref:methionyl-tRNA formyltransferase n=1 Tax=Paucibacter sp. XJ19-41 TaxID=2927824 RepID=UPI00234BFFF0|nr:methionyl-tRNA formyltransferase [Paucibacter sp. XJ19-41]MDC6169867.1 methionyl-tRNA formyltransferase [Paucibacter sp. XJ19-41]
MRVVFAGTPEFAKQALACLRAAGHEIPLVLSQPDRPAGRGMKLQASPVKQFAVEHGIAVAQPRSLRLDGKYPEEAAAARQALLDARPDVMVVAAYGLILPQWVLDLPRLGCLNIHASLLPRWRGAAPIHRAIEAGDARTGITIMQMDAGLDTGDMLLVEALDIAPQESTATLHDRLAAQGGRLIVDALQLAEQGALRPVVQPAEGVCYAHKIEKAEGLIDWTEPAAQIERRLRAFDPFPGGQAQLDGEILKCWRAELAEQAQGQPGEVLAADERGLLVACGEQALRLTELQRAGGKRLPAQAFLQARPVPVGSRFITPAA